MQRRKSSKLFIRIMNFSEIIEYGAKNNDVLVIHSNNELQEAP
jgi:hypothetical protein